MNAFGKVFDENLVLTTIMSHLPRSKRTRSTISFNCPMCHRFGHRSDTRMRGGLGTDDGIGISCFNCNFKTRYRYGDMLSKKMKEFLSEIGVSDEETQRLNYWAMTLRDVTTEAQREDISIPTFTSKTLPDGAKSIQEWAAEECNDPNFITSIEYLYDRGLTIAEATTYYWTPNTKNYLHKRIIIPCYWNDMLVGWTARATVSDIKPKYFNDTPVHFLFNTKVLNYSHRKSVILVEGIFDALAIDGVGLMGNKLNDRQVLWINNSRKRVIVVPDRDSSGKYIIDTALANDWEVSFPRPMSIGSNRAWWDNDIKDAASAVNKYGKLYTLNSIFQSCTSNKMQINIQRNSY